MMKRNCYILAVVAAMLICQATYCPAQESARKGENLIMTGFNMKDSVINAMIDADAAKRGAYGCGNLIIPRALNKIPLSAFDDDALWVCKKLHEAGYKAYIIGGAVRDLLMGRNPDDADITTDATIEQQKAIFGDRLNTHVVGVNTYCKVRMDDGTVIDLAAFQRCPAYYIDHGLVTTIARDSISVATDSYRRDLPMNAIFYDPYSGDVIDYHGGLQDIRDNTIHTSIDPDANYISDDNSSILRTLRFQAKYNATLAPALEEALMKKAPEYISLSAPNSLYSNITKMFMGGYSVKCYRNLLKYRIFDYNFPCLSLLKNRKAYNVWLEKELARLDEMHAKGMEISKAYAFAAITYPVYKQLRKKMDSAAATKKIIDMQTPVMVVSDGETIQKAYEKIQN